MTKFQLFYANGDEVRANDRVLVNDEYFAFVENILMPGSQEASNYSCYSGGVVLVFDNGDTQVWPYIDEDLELIDRQ